MAISVVSTTRISEGNHWKIIGTLALDSSYPTGGYAITPAAIGLDQITSFGIFPESGIVFQYTEGTGKIQAFQSAGFTPAGSISSTSGGTPAGTVAAPTWTSGAYTPAGTNSAPAFTGTAPTSDLNLATPAFSGTGTTAAAQVITTTDNQTMTLNQCAGMWLIQATQATPPNMVLSNTVVSGVPAVLTVQGSANTDAGTYKIVKALTPVGSVAAPTFTGSAASLTGTNSAPTFTGSALATHTHTFTGTAVAAGAGTEVANATDLSAFTTVEFEAIGL